MIATLLERPSTAALPLDDVPLESSALSRLVAEAEEAEARRERERPPQPVATPRPQRIYAHD